MKRLLLLGLFTLGLSTFVSAGLPESTPQEKQVSQYAKEFSECKIDISVTEATQDLAFQSPASKCEVIFSNYVASVDLIKSKDFYKPIVYDKNQPGLNYKIYRPSDRFKNEVPIKELFPNTNLPRFL